MFSFLRRHWLLSLLLLFFLFLVGKRLLRDATGKPAFDDPEVVAQWIVDGQRDPRLCLELRSGALPFPLPPIRVPFVMGPTLEMQRKRCIFTVAQMTSNPRVCEILLPSEYGLACISNMWPEVSENVACGWNVNDNKTFQCRTGYGELRQSTSCDDFKENQKEYSVCLSEVAEREKNLSKCSLIPDAIVQNFCETRIGAWQKYPQLRTSFYFGTQESDTDISD